MINLGDLPGGDSFSVAASVSHDGSVVVGGASSAASLVGSSFTLDFEAFRWMTATGKVSLGMPATPQGTPSYATASR